MHENSRGFFFQAEDGIRGGTVTGVQTCALPISRHGIKTHNAIKALHLDELFGSKAGGCVPGAKIEKLPSPFRAVQRWNANRKLGQRSEERRVGKECRSRGAPEQ